MPLLTRTDHPVDVILVGYTAGATERALAICDQVLGGLAVASRLLVLNNADQPDPAAPGWTTLRGSNALGEFSAWHEGLAALRHRAGTHAVLFVNDTLGTRRHLSRFARWALRKEIVRAGDRSVLVSFTGQKVAAHDEMSIAGLALHGWMSSYCFLLTPRALGMLGGKLYDADEIDACVRGGSDEHAFFTDRVSPALRRHLAWWLFQAWHRSETLTAKSQDRLAFKAKCICAELLLSARCRALGVALHDPLERHPLARLLDRANSARWALLSEP